jgi:hypothetical protein
MQSQIIKQYVNLCKVIKCQSIENQKMRYSCNSLPRKESSCKRIAGKEKPEVTSSLIGQPTITNSLSRKSINN